MARTKKAVMHEYVISGWLKQRGVFFVKAATAEEAKDLANQGEWVLWEANGEIVDYEAAGEAEINE